MTGVGVIRLVSTDARFPSLLGRPRRCADDELALLLELDGDLLDRKVDALLLQESQTSGLVEAVGLERFRAWVAAQAFAAPLE